MAIKREEKDERVKMGGGRGGGVKGPKGDSCVAAEAITKHRYIYVAYLFVHSRAFLSWSSLFVNKCVAMLPTRGSRGKLNKQQENGKCKGKVKGIPFGFGSDSNEQIDNNTFDI